MKGAPTNGRAFRLGKHLSFYIIVEIFVTSGVFFIIST